MELRSSGTIQGSSWPQAGQESAHVSQLSFGLKTKFQVQLLRIDPCCWWLFWWLLRTTKKLWNEWNAGFAENASTASIFFFLRHTFGLDKMLSLCMYILKDKDTCVFWGVWMSAGIGHSLAHYSNQIPSNKWTPDFCPVCSGCRFTWANTTTWKDTWGLTSHLPIYPFETTNQSSHGLQ